MGILKEILAEADKPFDQMMADLRKTPSTTKLINNPSVFKGKTIASFKSNGYQKGYTITFTDGIVIDITSNGQGSVSILTRK